MNLPGGPKYRGDLGGPDASSVWGDDVLRDARETIIEIMRSSQTPRNAEVRLRAAAMILNKEFLRELTDEQLLAEFTRRTQAKEGDAARATTAS